MLSLREIVLEILKEDFKNYCFDNADEFSQSDSEAYGDTYVSSGNYIDESSKEVLLSRFKDEKLSDIDSFMEDIINDDRFALKIEEVVKDFKGD